MQERDILLETDLTSQAYATFAGDVSLRLLGLTAEVTVSTLFDVRLADAKVTCAETNATTRTLQIIFV